MLKTTFLMLVTIMLAILALPCGLVDWRGKLHSYIMRGWARLFLFTSGIELRCQGAENLQQANPAIIIINHESALDIPVIIAALPIPLRFLAKVELFRIPVFGWALFLGGHIPVDRQNSQKAIKTINKKSQRLVAKGINLIVSPEGTRSVDGTIKPFKKGGFVLAEQYQIPLIPVTMMGNRYCVPKKSMQVEPGILDLIIDQPVHTRDYETLDQCIAAVRNRMVRHKEQYEAARAGSGNYA